MVTIATDTDSWVATRRILTGDSIDQMPARDCGTLNLPGGESQGEKPEVLCVLQSQVLPTFFSDSAQGWYSPTHRALWGSNGDSGITL